MDILNNLSIGSLLVGGQLINKDQKAVATQATNPVVQTNGSRYSASITVDTTGLGDRYAPPKLNTQVTFSNPLLTSSTSQLLASNLAIAPLPQTPGLLFNALEPSLDPTQRLAGGSLRLGELADLGEDYEQDIRQYAQLAMPDENGRYQKLDLTGFTDKKSEDLASINLQLKTRDGDTINFSLTSYEGHGIGDDERPASFTGTRVAFEFEGQLSKEELEQVQAFAHSINQASAHYFDSGGVDFEALDLASFSQFSAIELSFLTNGDGSGDQHFKLNYEDSTQVRSIDVNQNGDASQISINKTSLGITMPGDQQQQALEEYLTLLTNSAEEAHANQSSSALMLSVFSLGFDELLGGEQVDQQSGPTKPITLAATTDNQAVKNGLVGLPDFDFSFDSKIEHPNAAEQPNEYVGFSLESSLKTQMDDNKSNDTSSITQTQKFDLSAAYYQPLDHLDEVDFNNQNYQYIELDRSSEKVTNLVTKNNELILALSTETGEFNKTTKEYSEGKLVDVDTKHREHSEVNDFTELAKQEVEQQTLKLLNGVMIDPYQQHQQGKVKDDIKTLDGRALRGQNEH